MYEGINEFKKGYYPRAYVIKEDYSAIIADTTKILGGWEQFYSNLLNFNQSNSLEGSEIYTAELEIQKLVFLEVELAVGS